LAGMPYDMLTTEQRNEFNTLSVEFEANEFEANHFVDDDGEEDAGEEGVDDPNGMDMHGEVGAAARNPELVGHALLPEGMDFLGEGTAVL